MSTQGIRVSYTEMTAAAAKLGTHRQTIEADLESARSLIHTLVTQGFVTQHASTKFSAATDEFIASAKKLIASMGDIGNYLTQTATAIEQVDRDLAAKIQATSS